MADEEIRFDRSLLGVEHPLGTFHVTREMIVDFAQATGETDPAFRADGPADLVAPATLCNVFVSGAERPDIKLDFGDSGLFAGQAIDCIAPVRAGDTLTATTKLKDVYAKTGRSGRMVFVVWETAFANRRGETVALVQESFVRRQRGG